jgi:hypothetical protein
MISNIRFSNVDKWRLTIAISSSIHARLSKAAEGPPPQLLWEENVFFIIRVPLIVAVFASSYMKGPWSWYRQESQPELHVGIVQDLSKHIAGLPDR